MLVSYVFVDFFWGGCSFVDVGVKRFCMGCVHGNGLGALAMSTRVGDLCVMEYFGVALLVLV